MVQQHKRYFGTDGIRSQIGDKLVNPDFVLQLGWAVGKVFACSGSSVLIGKDTRISGYMIESALQAGLSAAGANVQLVGPLPTPGIAYLTRTLRAQVGIVISASHNPYPDNGIKFFSNEGYKLTDELELAIESHMGQNLSCVAPEQLGKANRIKDAQGRYIEYCKSSVPLNFRLDNVKIVVDCANGAGYHVAPCVFHELGAYVIPLADQPDGFNINHKCGSTDITDLQQQVVANEADLGLALDGDGDRVIMVDHHGDVVDGDDILYILLDHLHQTRQLAGGLVGTIMSNTSLAAACAERGVPFTRAKVGDRHVMTKLIDNEWLLGGEPSGHIVNLAKTTSGDGIITALQILTALHYSGFSLHEYKAGLDKLPQKLISIKTEQAPDEIIKHPNVQKLGADIAKRLGDNGRVSLRASGTEPKIRVMVEAENDKLVDRYLNQLISMIQELPSQVTI
jgi:phosphoglucosamine mutase